MIDYRELVVILFCVSVFLTLQASTFLRSSEKQTICTDHLHNLYQANSQYEEDYDSFPPVTIPQKPLWKFWSNCLRPYVKVPAVLACPADERNSYFFQDHNPLFIPKEQLVDSYGMNYFLTRKAALQFGQPPKLTSLSHPEQVVFLGDSQGPYILPDRFWKYEKAFRHKNQSANFIFADGSVRNLQQEYFGTYDADGKFITNFSKWHWN